MQKSPSEFIEKNSEGFFLHNLKTHKCIWWNKRKIFLVSIPDGKGRVKCLVTGCIMHQSINSQRER